MAIDNAHPFSCCGICGQFNVDGGVASARGLRRTEFVRLRARHGRREIKHGAVFVHEQPEKAHRLAQVDRRLLICRGGQVTRASDASARAGARLTSQGGLKVIVILAQRLDLA